MKEMWSFKMLIKRQNPEVRSHQIGLRVPTETLTWLNGCVDDLKFKSRNEFLNGILEAIIENNNMQELLFGTKTGNTVRKKSRRRS